MYKQITTESLEGMKQLLTLWMRTAEPAVQEEAQKMINEIQEELDSRNTTEEDEDGEICYEENSFGRPVLWSLLSKEEQEEILSRGQ